MNKVLSVSGPNLLLMSESLIDGFLISFACKCFPRLIRVLLYLSLTSGIPGQSDLMWQWVISAGPKALTDVCQFPKPKGLNPVLGVAYTFSRNVPQVWKLVFIQNGELIICSEPPRIINWILTASHRVLCLPHHIQTWDLVWQLFSWHKTYTYFSSVFSSLSHTCPALSFLAYKCQNADIASISCFSQALFPHISVTDPSILLFKSEYGTKEI